MVPVGLQPSLVVHGESQSRVFKYVVIRPVPAPACLSGYRLSCAVHLHLLATRNHALLTNLPLSFRAYTHLIPPLFAEKTPMNTNTGWGSSDEANKRADLYFRKEFTLSGAQLTEDITGMYLYVKRNDATDVWVNGNKLLDEPEWYGYAYYGAKRDLDELPVSANGNYGYAARQPHGLVVGTNVLAIKLMQSKRKSSKTSVDAKLVVEKGYSCTCKPGYEGNPWSGCTEIDECVTNPCPQPGIQTCVDGFQSRTCSCIAGYTMGGNGLCTNINDCWPYPCAGNTDCTDGVNSYTCACKTGFTGADPYNVACTPTDECTPDPCAANTDCTDGVNTFTCTCKPGYTSPNPTTTDCTNIDDCSPNPCGANADCTDGINTYTCACQAGYEGDAYAGCTMINNCIPTSPCAANTACTPTLGSQTCTCLTGYTSPNPLTTDCVDIVDCTAGICGSDSTCTELVGGHTCACNSGFYDPAPAQNNCQDIDDCTPNPCGTNAVCADAGANAYTCSCPSGYTGNPNSACVDIDDCTPNPCATLGVCTDTGANSFSCACPSGYESADAKVTPCTNIDDCNPDPCAANTDCTDGLNAFTCACQAGTSGDPYNAPGCAAATFCIPGACPQPNSFCTEGATAAICACNPGFTSPDPATSPCVNIDDCVGNTCPANSQCNDLVQGYECQCISGYTGTPVAGNAGSACTNIDDCALTPCGANTACTDGVNSRTCACLSGYTGNPEVACSNIDDCAGSPCATSATCTDGINTFTCACDPGFNGDPYSAFCSDIDDCTPNPCGTGAICTDTGANSFSCACPPGAAGNPNAGGTCTQVDDCVPFPKCAAQATCTDGINSFSCACNPGYESVDPVNVACTNIDDCATATCRANSTCVDKLLGYDCPCNPGFVPGPGPTDPCVNIDDCALNPCGTGAECEDLIQDRICRCPPGWNGNPEVLCEDIDECLAQPCDVKATCENLMPSGYRCTCPPGFGTNDNGATCFADAGVLVLHGTLATHELGGTDTYVIRLAFAPAADVTITMSSNNLNEVVVAPPAVTFTPTNWNVVQTVTLTGRDDPSVDGTQQAVISHDIISTDFKYQNLSGLLPDTPVSNEDRGETAGLFIDLPPDGLVLRESPDAETGVQDSITYSITLTSKPLAVVTVDVTNDGSEIYPASIQFTFDPNNFTTPYVVNLTAINDVLPDGPREKRLTHHVSSTDEGYSGLSDTVLTVTVQDDDSTDISPVIEDVTPVSVSGGVVTITGQRFGNESSVPVVIIDGTACGQVNRISNTTLTCVVPPGDGAGLIVEVTVWGLPNIEEYADFFYITTISNVKLQPETMVSGSTSFPTLSFTSVKGLPSKCKIYFEFPEGFTTLGNVFVRAIAPTTMGPLTTVTTFDTEANKTRIVISRPGSGIPIESGVPIKLELQGVKARVSLGVVPKTEYEVEIENDQGLNFEGPTTGTNDITIINIPTPPGSPSVGDLTRVSAVVSWKAPASDNLSPITAYDIYRDGDKIATVDGNTFSYTLSGLQPYTDYKTYVRAVNAAGASDATVEQPFKTIYDVPTITSVSPSTGSTKGGNVIDIKGSWFTQNAATVREILIGEKSCASSKVWVSESHIRCTTPPSDALESISSVSVSVETEFGKASATDPFVYYPNPAVASLSATEGGAGGGTAISITGSWLGTSAADIISITVAGEECSGVEYITQSLLVCITGALPDGTSVTKGPVVVKTLSGSGSSVQQFQYKFPMITSLAPEGGVASGKTVITLLGQDLGQSREDISAIKVAGLSCLDTLWYESMTKIGCTTPAAIAGTVGPVEITTVSRRSGSSAPLEFKYLSDESPSLPSLVLSLFPPRVPLTGNVKVGISGVWLGLGQDDLTDVKIGSVSCLPSAVWKNSSYIECTAPESPTLGSEKVIVSTKSAGPGSSQASLIYEYPPPEVHAIRPAESKASGGKLLTVRGAFFGIKDTKQANVLIGGIDCKKTIWLSSELLLCETPPLSAFPKKEQDKLFGPARKVQFPATVTIADLTSKQAPELITYFDDNAQTCSPPCGWTATCKGSVCECIPGYSFPPKCESKNVVMTPINGSTSELGDKGNTAWFSIHLNEPPESFNPVIIRVLSNDTSEGLVTPGSLTFTSKTWSEPQTATVMGVSDDIRDGNITYAIKSTVKLGPARFTEGPPLDLQVITNHERPPIITKMWPSAIPLTGGTLYAIARNLDMNFTVFTEQNLTLTLVSRERITNTTVLPAGHDSTLVITQVREDINPSAMLQVSTASGNSSSSSGSGSSGNSSGPAAPPPKPVDPRTLETPTTDVLLQFTVPAHPEGYQRLTLLNEGGTRVDKDHWLYFSGGCIHEQSYGTSPSECKSCEAGAECPGGNRLWPQDGNFNTGEQSGFVEVCDPPLRCKGGSVPGAMCNDGYQGFKCGDCAEGFTKREDVCVKCPAIEQLAQFAAAVGVMWVTLAAISSFMRDQIMMSLMVLFVRGFQSVAVVSISATHDIPPELQGMYQGAMLFSGDLMYHDVQCFPGIRFSYEALFFMRLGYNLLILLPFVVFVPAASFIAVRWHKATTYYPDEEHIKRTKEYYRDRFVRCFNAWIVLMYFSLTWNATDSISCRKIAGSSWLISNPAQKCMNGGLGVVVYLLSIVLVIAVTAGVPMYIIFKLHGNKDKVHSELGEERKFKERMGIHFDLFNHNGWYWTALDFVTMMLIALGPSALRSAPSALLALGMALHGGKIILCALRSPYSNIGLTGYHISISVGTMFALLTNYLAREGKISSPLAGTALSIGAGFFIAVPSALLLTIVLFAIFFEKNLTKKPEGEDESNPERKEALLQDSDFDQVSSEGSSRVGTLDVQDVQVSMGSGGSHSPTPDLPSGLGSRNGSWAQPLSGDVELALLPDHSRSQSHSHSDDDGDGDGDEHSVDKKQLPSVSTSVFTALGNAFSLGAMTGHTDDYVDDNAGDDMPGDAATDAAFDNDDSDSHSDATLNTVGTLQTMEGDGGDDTTVRRSGEMFSEDGTME
eukprot:TRINITY_DN74_c0_g3_i1.p1 TRINITY_DN74_c0_g3~~TRINITY_DN74_c0_g3_i1.p1  ORF type:complete len:2992 (+),score=748.45 TRINITY_DN74_c0_g3_i1:263-9238(+)